MFFLGEPDLRVSLVEDDLEDLLQHVAALLQRQVREEVLDEVRQRHHQVVEHVRPKETVRKNKARIPGISLKWDSRALCRQVDRYIDR